MRLWGSFVQISICTLVAVVMAHNAHTEGEQITQLVFITLALVGLVWTIETYIEIRKDKS